MIFVSFKAFNLEWIRTQNCLLPSIGVNQGTGSVKTGRRKFLQKTFFHFPSLYSSYLRDTWTHTSVMLSLCGTHETRGSGKEI